MPYNESYIYYTSLLQKLTLYEKFDLKQQIITDEDSMIILNSFIELLSNKDNKELIGHLFYSICFNKCLSNLRYDQIQVIINESLKLNEVDGVFDNLCTTIINSEIIINFSDYEKILKYALGCMDNFGAAFSAIPDEVDDDFKTPMIRITSLYNFYNLTKLYITNCSKEYWMIVKTANKELSEERNNGHDVKDFYDVLFTEGIKNHLFISSKINIKLVEEFLLNQIKCINIGYWFDKILNVCKLSNPVFWKIIFKLAQDENFKYFAWHELSASLYKNIVVIEDYYFICDKFNSEKSSKVNEIFNYFKSSIYSEHHLYKEILNTLNIDLQRILLDKASEQEKRKKEDELLKIKPQIDIDVLFNKELLIEAINILFDFLNKDIIIDEDLLNHHFFRRNLEINTFVSQYSHSLLRGNDNKIKKELFLSYADKIYGSDWGIHFARYLSTNHIEFTILDKAKKKKIFQWITSTLQKYPMNNPQDCKYRIQQVICYLLNKIDFNIVCEKISKEMLIGAALSGFPTVIEGVFSHNYESFSINYLERYIPKKDILSYIIEEFTPKSIDDRQVIAFSGYIIQNISDLIPYQLEKIKVKLITYLNRNMGNLYNVIVRELMGLVGVKLDDLSKELFLKELVLEKGVLKYNYASSFLLREIPENEKIDNQYLLSLLIEKFNNSKDMLKVKISENIISRTQFAGDVFVFYANYILESDLNKISSRFTMGGFGGGSFYFRL
ncbi:hypothetical protein [Marispirochaeta sp.]|uniref:hypothetical protein n=1 Tax=Marispirochaeta sp. TaxID=2038653 RepID=UPI0029C6E946|nr:hypothetical protein [Marispirochaeta sp.]